MGYIYVVTPVGNELRPIDLDKRCFDGRRPYPPEVNHNNVKLGKTERPIHHRHREYKKILHNLIFKPIIYINNLNELKEFEDHLKRNCFSKYIKDFQNKTKRTTREWMEGIDIDEVVKTTLKEYNKNKIN